MHLIPRLRVKNLKVLFGRDGKAVDGISFDVNEDEIVGLVGESGSGKTVTALAIMKLLPKSAFVSGEIALEGRGAMVFQEPFTSLNPVLRAGEQVDEVTLSHEKTLLLLAKVRMSDPERIYKSYPHQLSGGEKQRVMIAMALALRPKLLIADEPTTALDVTIQAEILELLLELKTEFGMAILFITHDFGIIKKLAGRVLVMKKGKIIGHDDEYAKRLFSAWDLYSR